MLAPVLSEGGAFSSRPRPDEDVLRLPVELSDEESPSLSEEEEDCGVASGRTSGEVSRAQANSMCRSDRGVKPRVGVVVEASSFYSCGAAEEARP